MLKCRLFRWLTHPSIRQPQLTSNTNVSTHRAPLSASAVELYKAGNHLPPRPTLPDSEIKESYVKGTGPGGQAINKTNSAAQLTHIPTGIVVKSQATRSKTQNYNIARRLLAEKVELLQKGDESRAVKVLERKSKKKRSAGKKKRRKYRELEGEKNGQDGQVDEDETVLDGDEDEEGMNQDVSKSETDRPAEDGASRQTPG